MIGWTDHTMPTSLNVDARVCYIAPHHHSSRGLAVMSSDNKPVKLAGIVHSLLNILWLNKAQCTGNGVRRSDSLITDFRPSFRSETASLDVSTAFKFIFSRSSFKLLIRLFFTRPILPFPWTWPKSAMFGSRSGHIRATCPTYWRLLTCMRCTTSVFTSTASLTSRPTLLIRSLMVTPFIFVRQNSNTLNFCLSLA